MKIRNAEHKDVEAICRMLVQISKVHHEGRPDLFRVAQKYNEAQTAQLIDDPNHVVLVAVNEDDEAVGYAICILQDHHDDNVLTHIKTLYLDDLCISQEMRGKRIGHALMQAVKNAAQALGCYNLTLNVWACNVAAQRFYEQCGMQVQKIGMECIL